MPFEPSISLTQAAHTQQEWVVVVGAALRRICIRIYPLINVPMPPSARYIVVLTAPLLSFSQLPSPLPTPCPCLSSPGTAHHLRSSCSQA